ncbi:TPA: NAD(P)H-binding protein [Staphylococcus aureus]|nr:NAD(P)H-binding protein [Staphylococcus aureus]HEB2291485.1 NAD(P)H-binding protein [Staphylococcus aureus]
MKITVLGANGAIGKLVVEEAVNAGHEVLAVARRQGTLEDSLAQQKQYGSLTDETFMRSVVEDADVILSAVGTPIDKKRNDMSTDFADGVAVLNNILKTMPEKRNVLIGTPTIADKRKDKKLFSNVMPNVAAKIFMPPAYRDLKKLQSVLERYEMNWTVVRFINPNLKTDGNGYTYVLGDRKAKLSISRRNIAKFMVHESIKPEFKHEMPIIFNK